MLMAGLTSFVRYVEASGYGTTVNSMERREHDDDERGINGQTAGRPSPPVALHALFTQEDERSNNTL